MSNWLKNLFRKQVPDSPSQSLAPEDYDKRLDQFYALWEQCNGDKDKFDRQAPKKLGLTEDDIEWIHSAIGSARFRAIFGGKIGSHTTNFEDDPWFLAAQRRFDKQGK